MYADQFGKFVSHNGDLGCTVLMLPNIYFMVIFFEISGAQFAIFPVRSVQSTLSTDQYWYRKKYRNSSINKKELGIVYKNWFLQYHSPLLYIVFMVQGHVRWFIHYLTKSIYGAWRSHFWERRMFYLGFKKKNAKKGWRGACVGMHAPFPTHMPFTDFLSRRLPKMYVYHFYTFIRKNIEWNIS